MRLEERIQNLNHKELQMLFFAASEAALHSEEEVALANILTKVAGQSNLSEGILKIVTEQGSLEVASDEVRADVSEALLQVIQSKKPFVQAGFSSQKIVALKVGQTFFALPLFLKDTCVGALGFCAREVGNREDLDRQIAFIEELGELLVGTVITRMLQKSSMQNLKQENFHLRQTLRDLEEAGRSNRIVGEASSMRRVYREIAQVAGADTTTLIRGETGTGKELVARAIHDKSTRSEEPFIAINCAALPESLLESELFGYEKGAFTGAHTARKGSFELADGGTLFLDEIGEMSVDAQSRLLRVLQEKEIQPVGGSTPRAVDVRLVCATNRNLEEAVSNGTFRQDLYYRINVFTIELPPMRDRLSDLPILTELFIAKYDTLASGLTLSTDALHLLSNYSWPGNVRELENVIQRAVLVSAGEKEILIDHLPHLLIRAVEQGTTVLLGASSFDDQVARFEKEIIEDALDQTRGNLTKAAELLQTTKRIIQYKSQKYGVHYQEFRRKL